MPKNKPARHTPTIDMTAMCDVAFLLLTFFMLTAKMKPQEAVIVDTPSSISTTLLPDVGVVTILVGKDGKVYIDPAGQHARMRLIENMNKAFSLNLDEKDMKKFAMLSSFGVPMENLKQWLNMDAADKVNLAVPGIPIDSADMNKNQLGQWLYQSRVASAELKAEEKMKKDYAFVVKADKDTPYPAIKRVVETLTDFEINSFNLITNMEGDPAKKPEAAPGG